MITTWTNYGQQENSKNFCTSSFLLYKNFLQTK